MDTSKVKDFSPQELNRRLEQQYTEIAQLAGGLAHEVKNPLSTIRLNMGLLEEDVEDMEESPQKRRVLKRIETVKRETLRLEELLNEFLNFTRANRLNLEPADANKELKDVVEFFRPQAAVANVDILEFYANDLPTVRIDKRSFNRAILNLLINSLQSFQGESGEILVRTRLCGSEVAIDLIDGGCGMTDETLQKIFEPFFSTKAGGSGLGLPTVRKVIEGHGGRIAIQSEPGRGTQFTLTFPTIPRISSGNSQYSHEANEEHDGAVENVELLEE
ncbi:MAG: ATP-binding protein [Planctomycetia bacterium]|nr:ATP-binding protein [Planctomycetia bacterium]